jgi:hypothetical protein
MCCSHVCHCAIHIAGTQCHMRYFNIRTATMATNPPGYGTYDTRNSGFYYVKLSTHLPVSISREDVVITIVGIREKLQR